MCPSIIQVIAPSQSSIIVHPRRSPPFVTHGHGDNQDVVLLNPIHFVRAVPVSQLALAWPPVYLLSSGEHYVLQDPRVYWPCIHHHPFVLHSSQSQGLLHTPSSPRSASVVSYTCPQCWRYHNHPQYPFCSITCSQYAALVAPQLKWLPSHHERYIRVVSQFVQRWTSSPPPNVLAVYKITWTDASRRSFEQYRNAVEARGRFSYRGLYPGNEQKQFRSTNRACTLGERGNVTPCCNEACWMCESIRLGFEPHLQRKRRNGFGIRLGAGIYTGYASSKADEYANNSHDPSSNVRAMLVCRVVIGQPCEMYREDPTISRPPPGYDCVLGRSVPGSAFTEDEYVVYDADAIRPAYLVLYEKASGY